MAIAWATIVQISSTILMVVTIRNGTIIKDAVTNTGKQFAGMIQIQFVLLIGWVVSNNDICHARFI